MDFQTGRPVALRCEMRSDRKKEIDAIVNQISQMYYARIYRSDVKF